MNQRQQDLLTRYVDAFVRVDHDALVSLLRDDATWSMPPYPLWLRGPADVRRWLGKVGAGCRGSKMVPLVANGSPAFAQYRASGPGGSFEPWAIQVVDVRGDRIAGVCSFLYEPRLFTLFGLPLQPEA
jgi:RNA polymerase sigma-70 factor (ECF subfamily)